MNELSRVHGYASVWLLRIEFSSMQWSFDSFNLSCKMDEPHWFPFANEINRKIDFYANILTHIWRKKKCLYVLFIIVLLFQNKSQTNRSINTYPQSHTHTHTINIQTTLNEQTCNNGSRYNRKQSHTRNKIYLFWRRKSNENKDQ